MGNIYRAYCKKCDFTVSQSTSRDFMSPFFLGKQCRNCGEWKSEWGHDENEWQVELGRWERTTKFNIFKPNTWSTQIKWMPLVEKP